MKIQYYLADQNPHRDRTRGMTSYSDGLMRALVERPGVQLSAVVSRSSHRPSDDRIALQQLPFRTDHVPGRLLADQLHRLLTRSVADVWHFPRGFLPYLLRPRQPTVGTVPDTIVSYYAEHYPRERIRLAYGYWCAMLARSIARFDLVLTLSEFSRRSIESFCKGRDIACPPIAVTYTGARWEEMPAVAGEGVGKQDYVVHLCSEHPHKRTDTLLEYWNRCRERQMDLPQLVLVGPLSTQQRARAAAMPDVEVRAPASSEELRRTLQRARALFLPSEIEGFGLPALEAYYLGTPVVFANGTVVEEVLGEHTVGGFELCSAASFAQAVEDVLNLDLAWVRHKGAELRARFAWSACADRTIAAYESVL